MKKTGHMALSGHALRTFLLVLETRSISRTAEKLGVTQSAVSHQLDGLRELFDDPLFIRAGRGIEPTQRSLDLQEDAREALERLLLLTKPKRFEPAKAEVHLKIIANDYQRDLVLPRFFHRVRPQLKQFSMTVVTSEMAITDALRNSDIDMIISPVAPISSDVMHSTLFSDLIVCFYDPKSRAAPEKWSDFVNADYASLTFLQGREAELQTAETKMDFDSQIALRVANFAGLPEFLRDSQMLAMAPSLLSHTTFKGLSYCQHPSITQPLPFYLLWHAKHQRSSTHQWLRKELMAVASETANL